MLYKILAAIAPFITQPPAFSFSTIASEKSTFKAASFQNYEEDTNTSEEQKLLTTPGLGRGN